MAEVEYKEQIYRVTVKLFNPRCPSFEIKVNREIVGKPQDADAAIILLLKNGLPERETLILMENALFERFGPLKDVVKRFVKKRIEEQEVENKQ